MKTRCQSRWLAESAATVPTGSEKHRRMDATRRRSPDSQATRRGRPGTPGHDMNSRAPARPALKAHFHFLRRSAHSQQPQQLHLCRAPSPSPLPTVARTVPLLRHPVASSLSPMPPCHISCFERAVSHFFAMTEAHRSELRRRANVSVAGYS